MEGGGEGGRGRGGAGEGPKGWGRGEGERRGQDRVERRGELGWGWGKDHPFMAFFHACIPPLLDIPFACILACIVRA